MKRCRTPSHKPQCEAVGDPVMFSCSRFSCRLYVNWRFLHGIEAQFLALQKGFNEVIPQHLLKSFDEKELEVKKKKKVNRYQIRAI